ncbi:MAG: hypothetical protein JSR98_06910 [Proteobacteria bacterium]|nr:hypothetical protein [Pseudomonadota bacterium]
MNRRWALLGIALAVAPAYAAFVYGWELAEFLSTTTRMGESLPPSAWGPVALTAAQMVVIAGALAMCWQFGSLGRRRAAVIAMVVAWLAAAPLYVLILLTRGL